MAKKICKGCVPPERYPGCHSSCPEYIKYRAELDEIARIRQQETIANLKSPVDKKVPKSLRKLRRASYYE